MHTFKVLASLTILVVLIVTGAFISSRVLLSSSQEIENKILEVEKNIYKNDWDLAKQNLSVILDKWPNVEKKWSVLLDHSDIDNVSTSIFRLSKYLESQNSDLALSEIAYLKQYLKNISQREIPSIENIF
ncbi:UNVERIFIED_CONTAM: uncharacterized protein DUF4363 [Acetivibrio alkalicellulosi]